MAMRSSPIHVHGRVFVPGPYTRLVNLNQISLMKVVAADRRPIGGWWGRASLNALRRA